MRITAAAAAIMPPTMIQILGVESSDSQLDLLQLPCSWRFFEAGFTLMPTVGSLAVLGGVADAARSLPPLPSFSLLVLTLGVLSGGAVPSCPLLPSVPTSRKLLDEAADGKNERAAQAHYKTDTLPCV